MTQAYEAHLQVERRSRPGGLRLIASSGLLLVSLASFSFGQFPMPPALVAPGSSSGPGPAMSTTTPTFVWQAVSGADGYGLYIRDMVSNTLIFDSEARYGGPISGTSLVLPAGVLAYGGQYRWNMRSHNTTGWGTTFSSPLYFTVQAAPTPTPTRTPTPGPTVTPTRPTPTRTPTPSAANPVITSTSPEPVPGSSSAQTLTIYGSNFVSGCTVTLADLTNGGTFPGKPTTFYTSGQISISANFTNATATWTAQVINPGGASSNVYTFHVQAAATQADLVPQGVSVSPTTVAAGGTITVSYTVRNQGGTNAPASHTKIQIKNPSNVEATSQVFSTVAISAGSSVNESHPITIPAGSGAGTYNAYVIVDNNSEVVQSNTSNDYSAAVPFTVQASAANPVITSTSPEPVPGSSSAQTLTIYGSNFVSGCTVTLVDTTYGGTFPGKVTTFYTSGQISISANFTNATATWTAQVINPGGAASNVYTFHVTSSGPCTLSCAASVPGSVAVGSSVSFQATATPSNCAGLPSYAWDFGDGSSSSQQNPTHVYASTGTIGWSVSVSIAGAATCTKSGTIAITQPGACYALSALVSPTAAGTVNIGTAKNCSEGYTSGTAIALSAVPASGWIFGKWSGSGGAFANTSSPTSTFTITGNAAVVGNFTQAPGAPTASFTYTPASPTPDQPVSFVDSSSGLPTLWSWDFNGDGVEDSALQNPAHTFTSAGPYQVTLVTHNAYGESRASKTVSVLAPTGTPSVKRVTRQYPGAFLQGGNFTNRFDVDVDWQGNPGNVTFSVNGGPPVTETGTRTGASHVFSMATDFPVRSNASTVTITATSREGVSSSPWLESLYVFPYPAWLSSLLDRQGGTVDVKATGTDVLTTFAIDYPQPHRKALWEDVPWFVPVFGNHPLGIVDEHTSGSFSVSSRQGTGEMVLTGTGVMTGADRDFHYGDIEMGGKLSLHAPQGLRLETGYYRSGLGFTWAEEFSLAEWIPQWPQVKVGMNLPLVGDFVRGIDESFKLRIPLTFRSGGLVNLSQDTAGNLLASDKKLAVAASLGAFLKLRCVPFVVNCLAWAGGGVDAVVPWPEGGFDSGTVGVEAGLAFESAFGFFASGCVWTWVGCSWSHADGFSCPTPDLYFEENCAKRYSRYERGGQSVGEHGDGSGQLSGKDEGRLVLRRDYARFGRTCAPAAEGTRRVVTGQAIAKRSARDQVVLTNVFPNAAPTIVELPQGELLLFGYQRPELPVVQSTELAWSLDTADGWTPLGFATHDTQADSFPAAAADATGRMVAVWLRVKDPQFSSPINTATDMQSFLKRYEVVSSVFDPKTKTWGPLKWLTNDDSADYAVQVSATATGAMMVTWLSNPSGVTFSSSENLARLRCAFWDGNAWGAVGDVATGLVGVYGYAAALRGDRAAVVIARDTDPSNPKAGVLDVYEWDGSRWRLVSTLGGDGSDNRSPTVAYDGRAQVLLVWLRDMDLVSATLPNPTPVTLRSGSRSLEFLGTRLLASNQGTLALIWAERQESDGGELHARLFDPATQDWSSDIGLNDYPFVAHDFTGHFGKDGVLRVVYLATDEDRQDVAITTGGVLTTIRGVPEEGRTDVHLLEHSLVVDLAVLDQDLRIEPARPRAGDTVATRLTVHNAGDFAVGSFDVDLYAGNPDTGAELVGRQTVAGQLAAGAVQELSLSFTYPAGGGDIVAVVDPNNAVNEFTMANNRATVYLTNRPPLAKVVANVTAGQAPLTVGFDASGSTDPDADSMTFNWAFADSSASAEGVAVTHLFAAPGNYPVTLIATDSHGAVGTATVTLTVLGEGHRVRRRLPPGEGACTEPWISTQPQSQSIQGGQSATVSVSANGTPPLTYQWYRGNSGDISNPVGSNSPSFTTPALTTTTSYWVGVSNACGQADSARATISVQPGSCTSWNQAMGPSSSYYFRGVAFGNGRFLAVGTYGAIFSSEDGQRWVQQASGTNAFLNSVTWTGQQFVVVGEGGTILTSPNGLTWTARAAPTTYPLNGPVYGGSGHLAFGWWNDGIILSSADGASWSQLASTPNLILDACWNGREYLAAGGNVLSSLDGVNWVARTTACCLRGITCGPGRCVAVGNHGLANGQILASSDGHTWTQAGSLTDQWLLDVASSGSMFVAVGNSGTILKSSDGANWRPENSGTTESLTGVTWGLGTFVAAGHQGVILFSTCP